MYYEKVYQDKIITSALCLKFCMNEIRPEVLTDTDMLGGRYRWQLVPTLMGSICLLVGKEQLLDLVLLWLYSLDRQVVPY